MIRLCLYTAHIRIGLEQGSPIKSVKGDWSLNHFLWNSTSGGNSSQSPEIKSSGLTYGSNIAQGCAVALILLSIVPEESDS